jgi:hypothetical protein
MRPLKDYDDYPYDDLPSEDDFDPDPGWADGDHQTALESVYGPEDDFRDCGSEDW